MSSSYYPAAAPAALPFSPFRRDDGDQKPAGDGLARGSPTVPVPETAAAPVVGKSGHDEHSMSPSRPPSGIKKEEGNEDGLPMPAGKQAAAAAAAGAATAVSGNIERVGDNGGRDSQGSSSEPAGSDSHAMSAVALLLLAASATSHGGLPASQAGVSANGSPMINTSSPSSAETETGTDKAGAAGDTGGGGGDPAPTAWSGSSRAQEAWPISSPALPSHDHLAANDPKPPMPVSAFEKARARGRSIQDDQLPGSAPPTMRIIGQQPFAGGGYRNLPPTSSQVSHSHGSSWSRGRGDGYEEPSVTPAETGSVGSLVPGGGGGGGVNGYGGSAGVTAGRGRWGNPQQQQSPRAPLPCSTLGGPPRVQTAWRRDPTASATTSLPMRVGGGGVHVGYPARSPRGKRSPSPPRSAGRKKPEGYRSSTWDGAGRGRKSMTPGGGSGMTGGGGGARRWTPHSARCAGRGKIGSNNRTAGISRATVGEGTSDAGVRQQQHHQQQQQQQQQQHQHHHHQRQQQQNQEETEINDIAARFYEQRRLQLQRLQQEQGRVEPGPSDWCRKRSRDTDEQEAAREGVKEEGHGELQPSAAHEAAGQLQWDNGRAAARAAGAATGGLDPRPSKRHQSGGAQKAPSTDGNLKVDASRRPLAMDLDMEASGLLSSLGTTVAAHKGVTGSGRPSPRKKSKNLVWSQFRKACDRCTDKKVRCDGSNPTGGFKACSPCERAGVPCLFGICRRSGPRDAHGHKTAAAGVIMKRNDFEKVTERLGQCRTSACRFVNEDGSFWREHFHCRVGDCSFAGKNMSELLLHRGKDHPELPEVTDSSAATVAATAAVATATAATASSEGYMVSERVKDVAAPYQRGVLC